MLNRWTDERADVRTDGQRDDLDNKMAACLVGQRYKDQTTMRIDKWKERSGLLSARSRVELTYL